MEHRETSDSGTFIHELLLMTESTQADRIVEAVRGPAETVKQMHGFVSLSVLASADDSQVLVLSEWQSRDDWSRAQWDATIQDVVVRVFQLAQRTDPHSYRRVFHIVGSSS